MQIRQARPAQRPARLLNNALDDAGSLNLGEGEDRGHGQAPVAAPPAVAMLPGEHRIRFWLKERSLLAVALHVKPGMTRAAEFLVPVQLCNRALSVSWPVGERLSRQLQSGSVKGPCSSPDWQIGLCRHLRNCTCKQPLWAPGYQERASISSCVSALTGHCHSLPFTAC